MQNDSWLDGKRNRLQFFGIFPNSHPRSRENNIQMYVVFTRQHQATNILTCWSAILGNDMYHVVNAHSDDKVNITTFQFQDLMRVHEHTMQKQCFS